MKTLQDYFKYKFLVKKISKPHPYTFASYTNIHNRAIKISKVENGKFYIDESCYDAYNQIPKLFGNLLVVDNLKYHVVFTRGGNEQPHYVDVIPIDCQIEDLSGKWLVIKEPNRTHEDYFNDFQEFKNDILSSKEKALKFMRDLGIIDENNELTKNYK
jgi:hypothetical protein